VKRLLSVLSLMVLGTPAGSWAQLRAPNEAGVALGHWHTIVRDVDAAKKFWVLYGGVPIQVDGTQVIKFPGVLVFLTPGTPSGGNKGTVVDHVGFGVSDVPNAYGRWKALGGKVSELRKSPLNGRPTGDVYSPDDLMVEFTEENGVPPYPSLPPHTSIESNHIHFYVEVSKRNEMRDWYVGMFGAIPGELGENLTGDIPGVKFMRWSANAKSPTLPTKGRALDHIGFEVKNLKAFCKKLEAGGVKFDQPYSQSRHKSFRSAAFTDPWGTSIELTEGLNRF
jgi:catechol 2,3-dioxygenase-like lactoylglutathione lyase family enzyme